MTKRGTFDARYPQIEFPKEIIELQLLHQRHLDQMLNIGRKNGKPFMAVEAAQRDPLCHQISGRTCLMDHGPGEGACEKCRHCNEFIRPKDMGQRCPKREDGK